MHCLNLKITYQCTNNCSFCFSSYLKDNVISPDGLKTAVKHGRENGCRELVISGGEPTLLPDVMIEILAYAEELGYTDFIIQTNGSGFADNSELLAFVKDFGKRRNVKISFSVHGDCAKIHDALSQSSGAFDKLMKGMENIAQSDCGIYTNTVITSKNVSNLKNIYKTVCKFHPEVVQFSIMHLDPPGELSARLLQSAAAVRELGKTADPKILRTEGIPFCLMYSMEKCVGESYWPNSLDLYNKNDDYMQNFSQLGMGMRRKMDRCSACVMNEICMGVWKENIGELKNSSVRPIM